MERSKGRYDDGCGRRWRVRYRRIGYRYTMVVHQPIGWGGVRQVRSGDVVLSHPHWHPDMDVYETEAALTVTVELAGVDAEQLEFVLFEDALVIEGRRSLPVTDEGVYHAAGIRQGPFRVEVAFAAQIGADGVEASYDRGLLLVRIPKAAGGGLHG
jgi:HSP20 family protein